MRRRNVLIVDDERDIVNVIGELLSLHDLEVYSAYSAESALNIFETVRFDIIITDQAMPGIGGVELTKIVKSAYPKTIVVGISGNPCRKDFITAGADFFLQKPLDFNRLSSIVKQAK